MFVILIFFTSQHSVSPEVAIHGLPFDNFSRSGSGGVNLCRVSAGLDLSEPAGTNWSSKTSIKFEVGAFSEWAVPGSFFVYFSSKLNITMCFLL